MRKKGVADDVAVTVSPGVRKARTKKDVPWPWTERGIGFSETCWVGNAL